MYLSRHRDVEKLPGAMTATSDHLPFPLLKTSQEEDTQIFVFLFLEAVDLSRKAFVLFAIRPSSLQGPFGGSAPGMVVLMDKSPRPRLVPCTFLMPWAPSGTGA